MPPAVSHIAEFRSWSCQRGGSCRSWTSSVPAWSGREVPRSAPGRRCRRYRQSWPAGYGILSSSCLGGDMCGQCKAGLGGPLPRVQGVALASPFLALLPSLLWDALGQGWWESIAGSSHQRVVVVDSVPEVDQGQDRRSCADLSPGSSPADGGWDSQEAGASTAAGGRAGTPVRALAGGARSGSR